ncbi:papilin isoform X2 [Protopterus annectens]|uniref:papilin isoform X2 n=1 Tax=Protopterus annectens TaxID=7888 RepID=UPI001CFB8A2C|nr:papilin isoform X2 [Protopterus annectens]
MKALLPLVILTLLPKSAFSVPNVNRQQDHWGHWSEWSECSRTCGGGVTFQERRCYSKRTDGGNSCIGPSRYFRSCNIQDCPEGSRDFREEQCAEFDGSEFQGKRYKWLPYYGAPNKCELNCIPKGENFYYRHKEKVIDGTPCEPGKRDICVEGVCKTVGCDSMLESSQKEDKCLECGGDGRTCHEIQGTFNIPDLPRGYNQIFIIPVGATSIRIKELVPSRNFLAIKNVRGEYYLNGHWTIEFSRALNIASTIIHYDRGAEGDLAPESIHGRGPTTEPLVIEMINQESNQGFQYEYYLPYRRQSQGYFWSYGSWTECSTECGGGYQSRLVFCTIDNEVYPDPMCSDKPRPMNNRTCNSQRCPQIKRWKTGPWSSCSTTCGGGSQSRSVYCVSYNGREAHSAVDDAECAAFAEKPHTQQFCSLKHCATWTVGPWSQCSERCGKGFQTRTVSCGTGLASSLQDFACLPQPKPTTTQSCLVQECTQEVGWHIGDWGLCSKSCGSGLRERQVICADNDRNFYGPENCNERDRPAIVEKCNTQSCYLPQLVPSMQDHRGYDITRHSTLTRYIPDAYSADNRYERKEVERAPSVPRPDDINPLVPSWDSYGGRQELIIARPLDCTRSLYGCCSDGQTSARGPGKEGCPVIPCQETRHGCCPDGITAAQGPNAAGCLRYYSDIYTGLNEEGPADWARTSTTQAPSREIQSDECRASKYGCCFDKSSPASGSNGEGCINKPTYPYPDMCLLPDANGPCSDWIIRWYFVPSASLCNRFWYGSCHGNKNNFQTEEECMKECKTAHHQGISSSVGNGEERRVAVHTEFVRQEGAIGRHQQSHDRSSDHTSAWEGNLERVPQSEHMQITGSSHWATSNGFEKLFSRENWRHAHHTERTETGSSPSHVSDSTKTSVDRKQAAVQAEWNHSKIPLTQTESEIYFRDHKRQPLSTQSRTHAATSGQAVLHEGNSKHVFQSSAKLSHTVAPDNRYIDRNEHKQTSEITAGGSVNTHRQSHVIPALHDSEYNKQLITRVNVDKSDLYPVEVTPGQTVQLQCMVDGPVLITFEWKKDGRQISSARHTYQSDGSLVISRVRTEDAGWYLCTASSDETRVYRQIQLKVQGVTQPIETSQSHSYISREEKQLGDRQNYRQSQTFVAEENRRDSTGYSQATFSENDSAAYRLSIDKTDPLTVDAKAGQTVKLPCRATGSPTVTTEWRKDNKAIYSFRHTKQPDGTLVINKLTLEDAGWYVCTAFNGRDKDYRQVRLRVQGELKITSPPPNVEVTIGGSVHLPCVVSGTNVNVKWSRNGIPVQGDRHHIFMSQDGSLILHNVQPADEGSYTCNAYSGSSSASATAEVKVTKPKTQDQSAHHEDPSKGCVDQTELANCNLIVQAKLCSNEYYSSFCCASCSQFQPISKPHAKQG